MANSLLPPEERNLTPDQVEALDHRREWGHTLLVIACQFAVIATVLLLWVGQDLTYSPGWVHPMAYYFAIAVGLVVVLGTHRSDFAIWYAPDRLAADQLAGDRLKDRLNRSQTNTTHPTESRPLSRLSSLPASAKHQRRV